MDQTPPKCFIVHHISIQLNNGLASDLTTLQLIYSPYYKIYMSYVHMSKTRNPSFYDKCYPDSLSLSLLNIFISNSIMSSLTHSTQYPHFCYTYPHFPFSLSGTFVSHKTLETLLHFNHPS